MSARFLEQETLFAGLCLIRRARLADERGFLSRLFCAEDLAAFGWQGPVAQLNETGTGTRGTVRGLHFQKPPHAEIKLVTCIRGRVFDVAVDLRAGSPTFLQHYTVELSEENALSLLIPKGFAHGFQTLSDDVRMIYAHSTPYAQQAEAGLDAADPLLAIHWPLPVANRSPRDQTHGLLRRDYGGIAA